MNAQTHRGIREAIRARIVAGEWKLGELIPGEVDFAEQYGCSRTTVNRALQALAEEGIVERKRKGGTRVRPLPLPQAQLRIPLVREQVEDMGRAYSCEIVKRRTTRPPVPTSLGLQIPEDEEAAYLETLHLADGQPFAFETRWVNLATVPDFETADFGTLSANEWLVRKVPFTRGEVELSAISADARIAQMLSIGRGEALFTMRRTTWLGERSVTTMALHYTPGYRLDFTI